MSSGLWALLLNLIALGLKFTLYFTAKRVLIEKGGPEMNGLASLDPRQAMAQIQAGAGGWGRGGSAGGGQQLGTAEAGQTSESEGCCKSALVECTVDLHPWPC